MKSKFTCTFILLMLVLISSIVIASTPPSYKCVTTQQLMCQLYDNYNTKPSTHHYDRYVRGKQVDMSHSEMLDFIALHGCPDCYGCQRLIASILNNYSVHVWSFEY